VSTGHQDDLEWTYRVHWREPEDVKVSKRFESLGKAMRHMRWLRLTGKNPWLTCNPVEDLADEAASRHRQTPVQPIHYVG
jgi:hypothetical protein